MDKFHVILGLATLILVIKLLLMRITIKRYAKFINDSESAREIKLMKRRF